MQDEEGAQSQEPSRIDQKAVVVDSCDIQQVQPFADGVNHLCVFCVRFHNKRQAKRTKTTCKACLQRFQVEVPICEDCWPHHLQKILYEEKGKLVRCAMNVHKTKKIFSSYDFNQVKLLNDTICQQVCCRVKVKRVVPKHSLITTTSAVSDDAAGDDASSQVETAKKRKASSLETSSSAGKRLALEPSEVPSSSRLTTTSTSNHSLASMEDHHNNDLAQDDVNSTFDQVSTTNDVSIEDEVAGDEDNHDDDDDVETSPALFGNDHMSFVEDIIVPAGECMATEDCTEADTRQQCEAAATTIATTSIAAAAADDVVCLPCVAVDEPQRLSKPSVCMMCLYSKKTLDITNKIAILTNFACNHCYGFNLALCGDCWEDHNQQILTNEQFKPLRRFINAQRKRTRQHVLFDFESTNSSPAVQLQASSSSSSSSSALLVAPSTNTENPHLQLLLSGDPLPSSMRFQSKLSKVEKMSGGRKSNNIDEKSEEKVEASLVQDDCILLPYAQSSKDKCIFCKSFDELSTTNCARVRDSCRTCMDNFGVTLLICERCFPLHYHKLLHIKRGDKIRRWIHIKRSQKGLERFEFTSRVLINDEKCKKPCCKPRKNVTKKQEDTKPFDALAALDKALTDEEEAMDNSDGNVEDVREEKKILQVGEPNNARLEVMHNAETSTKHPNSTNKLTIANIVVNPIIPEPPKKSVYVFPRIKRDVAKLSEERDRKLQARNRLKHIWGDEHRLLTDTTLEAVTSVVTTAVDAEVVEQAMDTSA